MPLSNRVVVRIEQIREIGVEYLVTGAKWLQYKRFEEPGRVCQMPLGRADVGHGLNDKIFGLEWLGNLAGKIPNVHEVLEELRLSAEFCRHFRAFMVTSQGGVGKLKVNQFNICMCRQTIPRMSMTSRPAAVVVMPCHVSAWRLICGS